MINAGHKWEIMEVGKEKEIPVYQAKKVPFKFKIEKEKIQY